MNNYYYNETEEQEKKKKLAAYLRMKDKEEQERLANLKYCPKCFIALPKSGKCSCCN